MTIKDARVRAIKVLSLYVDSGRWGEADLEEGAQAAICALEQAGLAIVEQEKLEMIGVVENAIDSISRRRAKGGLG